MTHGNAPSAERRAQRKWLAAQAAAELAAKYPADCGFCRRGFKTERGAARHRLTCWQNPEAKQYVSGDYDATIDDTGRIVGFVWNGDDEHHRRRIRDGMVSALGVMGMPAPKFAKSHRKPVLGPDLHEPCAVCPDSRQHHADCAGACTVPGCRCREFTGATA